MRRRSASPSTPETPPLPSGDGIRTVSGLVVLTLLFAGAAYQRNSVWEDRISLYADAAGKSLRKSRTFNNLGQAYYLAGRLDKAMEAYRTATALDPDNAVAHYNLGVAYYAINDLDAARGEFDMALRIEPELRAAQLMRDYVSRKGRAGR